MNVTDKYVLFWGSEFSNWFIVVFKFNGINFTSSEQALMYMKAIEFDDKDSAEQILNSNNPRDQKAIGRKVKNYNEKQWNLVRLEYMEDILYAKFSQNKKLKNLILGFGDRKFVEASPYDKIWGIGLGETDPDAQDETKWLGSNLLGKALDSVKNRIKNDI